METIDAMKWRYAAKRMSGKKIPEHKINKIIEAMHLAPSGIGLQPYELIIITNNELKNKIQPIAFNQMQIVECSHLIVFAAWDTYSNKRIDKVFDHLAKERNLPLEKTSSQRNFSKSFFGAMSEENNFHHAAKQAHIALGIATLTAALEGIDATPMEGFDPIALDALLGLKEKGLKSSMLLALGYRNDSNDWNLNLKKVRKPMSEFITEIK
ncbi:NAD(P)H-dependent oxidoreductase [Flavivirga sp. 57AJ16]|uniref:NAD(P)H-dependent oxidoreductase n=1 Tax=Flavivirga sp. 57AJ16 TaxID=3025307 RepID=UPI002366B45F|nr:NAD(P)H-dependent oxidoreductase [Flavivirga sp. 57AJ16]MDD7887987.1 NAD(P)H-dependent oxidoreductase [Flavivirga sp. 57AJ16]